MKLFTRNSLMASGFTRVYVEIGKKNLSFDSNDFVFPPPDFSHTMTVQYVVSVEINFPCIFLFREFLIFFFNSIFPRSVRIVLTHQKVFFFSCWNFGCLFCVFVFVFSHSCDVCRPDEWDGDFTAQIN